MWSSCRRLWRWRRGIDNAQKTGRRREEHRQNDRRACGFSYSQTGQVQVGETQFPTWTPKNKRMGLRIRYLRLERARSCSDQRAYSASSNLDFVAGIGACAFVGWLSELGFNRVSSMIRLILSGRILGSYCWSRGIANGGVLRRIFAAGTESDNGRSEPTREVPGFRYGINHFIFNDVTGIHELETACPRAT